MDSDEEDQNVKRNIPVIDDSNKDLPALFWDTLPENHEEHPDYLAIKALEEESSPEDRATSFKDSGNNKLKIGLKAKNRILLREAVGFYTKGLDLKCSDSQLNAVLYNNRSHVHSLLGNWRTALEDSLAALQLEPDSVKALYRGARAALKLGELSRAQTLCQHGLEVDPSNKEIEKLAEEVRATEQKLAREAEKRAAAIAQVDQPLKQIAAAVIKRGIRLTMPQVHAAGRMPYVDEAGGLHWPAVLKYPEAMQQDVVEDWSEDDTVAEQLDLMFGENAPPLTWDEKQEYTRAAIELYYLSYAGQPVPMTEAALLTVLKGCTPEGCAENGPNRYGNRASRWLKVPEKLTLLQIMERQDFIVPGIPLFWVVARGTEYRERFLAEELRR